MNNQGLKDSQGNWVCQYPLPLLYITQTWTGASHKCNNGVTTYIWDNGYDTSIGVNTPIYAPFDGVVVKVFSGTAYANTVVVRSSSKVNTPSGLKYVCFSFAHGNTIPLGQGSSFKAGQKIGETGNYGLAEGPHAHLMCKIGDTPESVWGGIGSDSFSYCHNSYLGGNMNYMSGASNPANVFWNNNTRIVDTAGLNFRKFEGGAPQPTFRTSVVFQWQPASIFLDWTTGQAYDYYKDIVITFHKKTNVPSPNETVTLKNIYLGSTPSAGDKKITYKHVYGINKGQSFSISPNQSVKNVWQIAIPVQMVQLQNSIHTSLKIIYEIKNNTGVAERVVTVNISVQLAGAPIEPPYPALEMSMQVKPSDVKSELVRKETPVDIEVNLWNIPDDGSELWYCDYYSNDKDNIRFEGLSGNQYGIWEYKSKTVQGRKYIDTYGKVRVWISKRTRQNPIVITVDHYSQIDGKWGDINMTGTCEITWTKTGDGIMMLHYAGEDVIII